MKHLSYAIALVIACITHAKLQSADPAVIRIEQLRKLLMLISYTTINQVRSQDLEKGKAFLKK